MNTFEQLLDRYLHDRASDEETETLMALLNTGQHDTLVRQRIVDMLAEHADEDISAARAGEMLQAIVTSVPRRDDGDGGGHIVPMVPRTPVWRGWWAAAVLVVLAVAGWLLWPRGIGEPASLPLAQQETPPAIHRGKQYIRLPDGSAVVLNDKSELRYNADFGTDAREVFLTGEAYFDIKHDRGRPFRVHTGKVMTTVLGTAFNIKAWPEAGEVKVTVDRGKVQVGDDSRTYGTITRDQQIAVNTATYAFTQTEVKAQEATEWKSTYLILDDMSLADAAALIEARYQVHVVFDNDRLKACRVSATFLNDEGLEQVMTVLTTVTQSTYTQHNNSLVLQGPGCGP